MNHCPNCGKEINPKLTHCPHCSFPLPELEKINSELIKQNGQLNMFPQNNTNEKVKLEPVHEQKPLKKASQSPKKEEPKVQKKEKVKKRNNSIVYILLILIILGLSGFIVYDKVLVKKPVKTVVNPETKEKVQLITEYLLTDQEAIGLGNYLWNYAFDTVWCNNFNYGEEEVDLGNGSKGFEITNYQDVSNNFTKDFTYEYKDNNLKFNDIFDNNNLNDKYYDVNKCNKEKDTTYGKTTLKIKSNEMNSIKYTATSSYCSDLMEGEECNDKTTTKTADKDFEIVKEDNMWKINKFVVPN